MYRNNEGIINAATLAVYIITPGIYLICKQAGLYDGWFVFAVPNVVSTVSKYTSKSIGH